MRRLLFLAAVLFVAAPASGALATTYYVSPSGSDSNSGTAASPWQTVDRINRTLLVPGDSVLFQGGQRFSGTTLIPPASGAASAPIRFGSYGTGRAQLNVSGGNDVWIPSGGHDLGF